MPLIRLHYYSYFTSLVWHPDGDIIGVGAFHNYNNIATNNSVKINPDGSKDADFTNICRGFDNSMENLYCSPMENPCFRQLSCL